MTSVLVRIGLVLTVLATVSLRHQAVISRDALVGSFDIGGAIETLLRENGLTLRESPVKPPRVLSNAVYFQRPQCAQSSVVMPLSLNYEALPTSIASRQRVTPIALSIWMEHGRRRPGCRCSSSGCGMLCSTLSARAATCPSRRPLCWPIRRIVRWTPVSTGD